MEIPSIGLTLDDTWMQASLGGIPNLWAGLLHRLAPSDL